MRHTFKNFIITGLVIVQFLLITTGPLNSLCCHKLSSVFGQKISHSCPCKIVLTNPCCAKGSSCNKECQCYKSQNARQLSNIAVQHTNQDLDILSGLLENYFVEIHYFKEKLASPFRRVFHKSNTLQILRTIVLLN